MEFNPARNEVQVVENRLVILLGSQFKQASINPAVLLANRSLNVVAGFSPRLLGIGNAG